jgi:hypothetical protein
MAMHLRVAFGGLDLMRDRDLPAGSTLRGALMQDANYLRALARDCRALSEMATEPEDIKQWRMWAADFTDAADDAERQAGEREEAETAVHRRS